MCNEVEDVESGKKGRGDSEVRWVIVCEAGDSM